MATLHIEGGRRLDGQIEVDGNKNAALPLLAACLLTDDACVLSNVPRIRDVEAMCRLLVSLGADVDGIGTTELRVQCTRLTTDEPDRALVGTLRGSVLLLGPLLARRGRARLAPPGGDFPARRTIHAHVQALTAMGARHVDGADYALDAPDGLRGGSIYLEEASVTGTETALLAAATARGETEIRHAACEPHVVELARFLRAMGVEIAGEGTPTIRVEGASAARGATRRLDGDYIEAGTWAVVAVLTGGQVEIGGARLSDLEPILAVLGRMGVRWAFDTDRLRVEPSTLSGTARITTAPWPGFPSDMVSLTTVLATQAAGRTLIHDWMYELRLFALEQLSGMNADLFLCDPHRIIVTGPRRLRGRTLDSRDLRSGMALIAAALAAEGASRVRPLETVERGYARVVERLRALGAQIDIDLEEG
ncbi:MAG: UDP-N-acetylglucosamine 1-carboxyvinyltransferase [Vicinamibacterales bacterium]|jgi:UDP-N-acetylglucosamine 1-carboxyvinyltransferase|nr:UDP-N-acetylglucosamine 1-carboxyvinyltransferase [Acidobacteriota bacterium]MDP6373974.1 UDP-N-acetylglucosamine 1-carboxyvinyltransferase [Vicinamibacterales bacterium]MDP6609448.1 UDP-N-acetylglucosamine 1-carboxyvinyltransferase [Vicinamibacterales bacterium]HAK56625.1 UDP-N-acetylglucosamine 1-carboxyvinyltransferase [Acidobacteriota bacterium]|tara:strand:+ start:1524 stop:2789 length:1266 start_codon:yes stop_codon:yes gene_type:complete